MVTALGLTREEKSLGYAVSKVSSDAINASVASNWIANMNGKVAGLSMTSAGTGPGGTVRVTLRGDASLNYGSNEALFVVDGVPILSGSTATTSDTPTVTPRWISATPWPTLTPTTSKVSRC